MTLPPWGFMCAMALALYAGSKWLTYREVRSHLAVGRVRLLGYLLAWPGMDARAFLGEIDWSRRPARSEWIGAAWKTLLGATLVWVVTRIALPHNALVAGWLAMIGLILLLHFGAFHLLSLGWRTLGVNARPLMQRPLGASSLTEFWGRRWNTAFHDLVARFTFQPLRRAAGHRVAMLLVFVVSGLIHELVISVPARGGYGLPTAYFALQGLGVAGERTRIGRRLGLGRGSRGWLFTAVIAGGPAFWLFPPRFVHHVIVPMLAVIGAS